MEMPWGWFIVIYLFLGGLGAGAYLTSFAAEKGILGKDSSLKRAGYYLAAPVVAIGTLLLVFDLGQGLHKPWLLVGLLSNLGSVMTWGVYILSVFIIIGLIKGFFVFKKKSAPAFLTWAGAVFALATGTYTGLLLSVVKAIPIWNSALLPFLFVVSALSTGLSATILLASVLEKDRFYHKREGQVHLLLIIIELLIAAAFLGTLFSGARGLVGSEAAQAMLTGKFALVFWIYFIGLGVIFPVAVFILQYLRSKQGEKTAETEPSLSSGEQAATLQQGQHSYLNVLSDLTVLIGGFALRALIIFAAIPIWDGFTIH